MKSTDKKNLLKWNTILWLVAMALPAFFSLAFIDEVSLAVDSPVAATPPDAGFQ